MIQVWLFGNFKRSNFHVKSSKLGGRAEGQKAKALLALATAGASYGGTRSRSRYDGARKGRDTLTMGAAH